MQNCGQASEVAANNPNAWIRETKTAEEIRTISGVNRPVSFPYPKLMNSNNNVDQASAALILVCEEKAKALGIPGDKWIYPWAHGRSRSLLLLESG